MSAADEARALIRSVGHVVTLRRLAGAALVPIDVACAAVVNGYAPNELARIDELRRPIAPDEQVATIDPTQLEDRQWPLPPQRGDQLLDGAAILTIDAVATMRIGEDLAFYMLKLRG